MKRPGKTAAHVKFSERWMIYGVVGTLPQRDRRQRTQMCRTRLLGRFIAREDWWEDLNAPVAHSACRHPDFGLGPDAAAGSGARHGGFRHPSVATGLSLA